MEKCPPYMRDSYCKGPFWSPSTKVTNFYFIDDFFKFFTIAKFYCIRQTSKSKKKLIIKQIFLWMKVQGSLNKFPDFFVWALLLIVHTWNSRPFRSNLLRLQCTCTVPTTSARPHGSPLVCSCQWPSSHPLSSPQLSHNDSLWA